MQLSTSRHAVINVLISGRRYPFADFYIYIVFFVAWYSMIIIHMIYELYMNSGVPQYKSALSNCNEHESN